MSSGKLPAPGSISAMEIFHQLNKLTKAVSATVLGEGDIIQSLAITLYGRGMGASRLVYFSAFVLLGCFVCRAQDFTAIRGNWHLKGSWDTSSTSPRLALSIGVDGDELLAMGGISVICPHRVAVGAALSPKGRIAADGTFLLTAGSSNKTTINGTVPKPGSEQWTGHYNFIADTAQGECSTGGDFVATRLPLLRGAHSGTLHLVDHSGDVTVVVDVNQGDLIKVDYLYWTPLQATMTLTGSAEFPSEELKAAKFPPERGAAPAKWICCHIDGDHFVMLFSANNGEQIRLSGSFMDAAEQSIRVSLENIGSKNGALGTLSRQ
jgi:hypothetical protein